MFLRNRIISPLLNRIIIGVLALVIFPTNLVNAEYFKHLSLQDGLSQPSVIAIKQDTLGRMWFGTREGINMYDGHHITTFRGNIENADGTRQWIGLAVNSIASDKKGNLYFGIGHNLVKYDIQSEKISKIQNGDYVSCIANYQGEIYAIAGQSVMKLHQDADSLVSLYSIPKLSRVSSLFVGKDGFYISTLNGLYVIDHSGKSINKLFRKKKVHSVIEDSNGIKWISLDDGWIYKMLPGKEPEELSKPDLGTVPQGGLQTREAIEDSEGKIWFGSFLGLFCHDPKTGITEQIRLPKSLSGLSHSSIYSLLQDRNGNIWVGSYYGGVNYFNPKITDIVNYTHEDHAPTGFFNSLVSDIAIDGRGSLWIATDGGGVSNLDSQWNIRKQLKADGKKSSILQNNIKSIAYDPRRNRLYIGTHLGGLSYHDIASGQTINMANSQGAEKRLGKEARSIFILEDSLYLSTRSGIWTINLANNNIRRVSKNFMWRNAFTLKGNGELYAYRANTLWTIKKVGNKYVDKKLIKVPEHIEKMSSMVYSNGNVYFAGVGVGLFRFEEKTGKLYKYTSSRNSLPSDYIYALCSGINGNIYITSDYGVTRLNSSTNSFSSIKFSDLFPESNIIEYCGIISDSKGNIYIGSTKGLTVIPESKFDEITAQPSCTVYFSQLKVQGKYVQPDDKTGILSASLPFTDKISLPPEHNNFSISLGFRDYMRTIESRRVKYKLDGFEKEWHVSSDGEIKYTNLNAGNYTLLVQNVSADGKTIDKPISIEVQVKNVWYATWWAKLIYFLIITGIVIVVIQNRRGRNRLHASLEKEKMEKANIEQLNKEKLEFFTNVSHEFQTPLTLIMSHIDILLSKYSKQKALTVPLKSIRNNAESLGSLVMQLLEYRKLKQNKQILKISAVDASDTVADVASKFNDYALQRDITYTIHTPRTGEAIAYYDNSLISKVVVNLLSNAFKYTPDGGNISVEVVKTDKGDVEIKVRDSGKGISSDEIPYIFDRFYNGNSQEGYGVNYQTTGIGLAYVKSIIEKHHGEINVESKTGEGSVFVVTLPGKIEVYESDENVNFVNSFSVAEPFEEAANDAVAEEQSASEEESLDEKDNSEGIPLVFISEDNDELRRNLREYLRLYYRVESACDGVEALEKIKELNPDIIVTDVLMPRMNGIELCKTVKNDADLCHIPVIILTALSSEEHNLAGLQANVDDYMTKPFSMQMLVARIDNLLRNRRILQKQVALKPLDDASLETMNPHDRKLLQQTIKVIDAHLSDIEFDIPTLCREVGISRTLFYNKFKVLTGMTPNAFILNYRLLHAAEMLKKKPHLSVAEVGDESGFNSTIYFSRCFKKQFGMSPQSYRKANVPDNNF